MIDCFVGLGGNLPGTFDAMLQVICALAALEGIYSLRTSRLYQTTPVSDQPQPLFLNAACHFQCTLLIKELWQQLQSIECQAGKQAKPKNAPRLIDIDLLFYGDDCFYSTDLIVPHPHWHERLFVLAPLADLVKKVSFIETIDLKEMLSKFSNPHKEKIIPLMQTLPWCLHANN